MRGCFISIQIVISLTMVHLAPKYVWKCRWSSIENQQDSTITIYWSPKLAQHVSGKILSNFRSARLRFFTAYGIVSCCCGRQGFGELSSVLHTVHVVPRCSAPNPCLPQQQDTITYAVKNLSLALLMMGKSLPETCWADLGDQ